MRLTRRIGYSLICMLILTGIISLKHSFAKRQEKLLPVFVEFCNQCHSLNRVYSVHRNRNSWKKLVGIMLEKADSSFSTQKDKKIKTISKENADKIAEYLYQKLGASKYDVISSKIE